MRKRRPGIGGKSIREFFIYRIIEKSVLLWALHNTQHAMKKYAEEDRQCFLTRLKYTQKIY